mmetsp:Transcript_83613/g.249455  ORF Transcript_83613/g.249455 Transcript_83613/m.249455 type:complete len:534 (+) Transcript_83613:66-1667(+)
MAESAEAPTGEAPADEAPVAEAEGETAPELPAFGSGDEVSAFFNSNEHAEGHRYVKVKDRTDGFPLIGQSAGWMPATVLEAFDPAGFVESDWSTWVHVQFSGTFRDTRHGHCEGLEMTVHPKLLRRNASETPALVLSLFCMRWWDYWSYASWSDWNVTSDGLFTDLFTGPCSVDKVLPGEYDVHTAWVQTSQDLTHIAGDEVRNLLRGAHISNWIFLWPTRSTTADSQPGCVCEFQYFAMTQRLERAGVPTGWPHTAYLYRQLSGRLMTPQMCLHPDYKVRATTRVHYAEFAEAEEDVANRAIGCLMDIRSSMVAEPISGPSELRGVAKLGFSWCPGSVESFCGASSLIPALNRLFHLPGSNQIVCLLQERAPDVVCEMRIPFFHDAAKDSYSFLQGRLWLRPQPDGDLLEEQGGPAPDVVSEATALEEFFKGSEKAMKKAMDDADKLADWWQTWFITECPEPPQYARLDLHVSHSEEKGTSVWSWEVGDCGSSLCGLEVGARNMAALNGAMRNDESGRFPMPLPPIRRRDAA